MNEFTEYSYYNYYGHNYDEDMDVEEIETYEDAISSCVVQSVYGVAYTVGILFFWNLVFRVLTQIVRMSESKCGLVSAICGSLALYTTLNVVCLYVIAMSIGSFMCLYIVYNVFRRFRPQVIAILGLATLTICELLITDKKSWHRVRGMQMIIIMKMISLAYDIKDERITTVPHIVEYLGYVLCPANVLFGPWVPFKTHISVFHQPIWTWYWFLQMIISYSFSVAFLLISNCGCFYFIPTGSWKWLEAYRDALSFRTSTYFISYLSEASMVTAGYMNTGWKNWGFPVTKPSFIELPRSLVQVVVYWNIPIHMWLKIYIFREARKVGIFWAIVITYVTSALLHGCNIQLAAVLLSIGIYTYVEFNIRKKLSLAFSACVEVHSCKSPCNHLYGSRNIFVVIVNITFVVLAIIHLAYLGVLFDTDEEQELGYSLAHTIEKWSHLNFLSHWIILISYISYILM